MMFTRSVARSCTLRQAAVLRRRALSNAASPWASFEMAPPDPIIGLNEAFQKDDYPQKVIVGVGAYRDDQGKPYVLPCVREAEKRIMAANLVSFVVIVHDRSALWCRRRWLLTVDPNSI